jgi:hypothetical protein
MCIIILGVFIICVEGQDDNIASGAWGIFVFNENFFVVRLLQ